LRYPCSERRMCNLSVRFCTVKMTQYSKSAQRARVVRTVQRKQQSHGRLWCPCVLYCTKETAIPRTVKVSLCFLLYKGNSNPKDGYGVLVFCTVQRKQQSRGRLWCPCVLYCTKETAIPRTVKASLCFVLYEAA
jgi:ferredoxin-thioredoxin reductase catalytic subunit